VEPPRRPRPRPRRARTGPSARPRGRSRSASRRRRATARRARRRARRCRRVPPASRAPCAVPGCGQSRRSVRGSRREWRRRQDAHSPSPAPRPPADGCPRARGRTAAPGPGGDLEGGRSWTPRAVAGSTRGPA
jgi:hypothetical protein